MFSSDHLRRIATASCIVIATIVLSGCDGDFAVPITSSPTRKIDRRLLGKWVSKDGSDKLIVRRYDDSVYVIYFDGDLGRAFHSDVAGTPFITFQDIDSDARKYAYLTYKLSSDEQTLTVRAVESKVIPKGTKTSSDIRTLLKKNAQNPDLLGDEGVFVREK